MNKKIKEDLLASITKGNDGLENIPLKLSILPLRDVVIFPNMIFPVLIGRSQSLKAIAVAMENNKYLFVSTQKDMEIEEPQEKDLNKRGTIVRIMQVMRLPNNLLKVLVEGVVPGRIKTFTSRKDYIEAEVEQVEYKYKQNDKELETLIKRTGEQFADYIKNTGYMPPELVTAFNNLDDPVSKLFYAATNIKSETNKKQKILSQVYLKKALFELSALIESELELLKLENEIDSRVSSNIQKTQKKYYIQEQIRELQKELGEEGDPAGDIEKLEEMLKEAKLPENAQKKVDEELTRLRRTPSMSPEFPINRNYLELVANLPWHKKSIDSLDIEKVRSILDEDHYDLEKPKDRILEFLSILSLSGNLKRQILCLSGPPGVGKTSLAKSIARALGREYVRISLGGVRDEAEIRGHRRTYIGSMPGKIIQAMKKAGTVNPVILLDEIDKMASDFRGDPASAMLEVLDPEQNSTFTDHHLEIEYDLSQVMFITTANVKFNIPGPLLDRMEVIDISSYLDYDKLEIAKRHILPKVISEFGLYKVGISITDEAIMKIITGYTKEAGVRNLERNISSLLRKTARSLIEEYYNSLKTESTRSKKIPEGEEKSYLKDDKEFISFAKKQKIVIGLDEVDKHLKKPLFREKRDSLKPKTGVATGLAWTPTGGDTLPVEVNIIPAASHKLTLTGKLGDVMKESAYAALSFIRANHGKFGLEEDFASKKEIHIHVPEGAIGKDGPSAGITMAMAIISASIGIPLRGDLAMTGEITLRGNILAIGGLKEKLLAAQKLGITTVFVPEDNTADLEEIPDRIKEGLKVHPVSDIWEAMPIAFPDQWPFIEKKKKNSSKKKNK
ncbi:MAG: endopeptidase La [Candidatus Kapaibacteriales bacterium]